MTRLLLLTLSVAVIMDWTGVPWSLSQDSDTICTAERERCAASAVCENQVCVCPPGQQGDGRLVCVRQEDNLCQVVEDYMVTGFGGATIAVNFPCSSRLAKFNVRRRMFFRDMGCVVDVFSVAQHFPLQRFYPRAVWVHLTLLNHFQWQTLDLDLVKKAGSGNSSFEFVSNAGLPLHTSDDGSTISIEWQGVRVISSFDSVDNFAVLSLPECNTTVRFRPADLDQLADNSSAKQALVPGITIQAPSDARWESFTYFSEPYAGYSLCGIPREGRTLWSKVRMRMGLSNNIEAAVRFAVTSHSLQVPRRPPHLDSEECRKPPVNILLCQRRTHAVRACSPILYKVDLIQCLRDTPIAQNVTLQFETFKSCFRFICQGQNDFCFLLSSNSTGTNVTTSEWTCGRHLHESLVKSLDRGCEEVHGTFPNNSTHPLDSQLSG